MTAENRTNLPTIGWRERLALPELDVISVKAKIDTGARSSALHAFDIELFKRDDADFVRFKVHPSQRNKKKVITAEAKLLEMRAVKNSGGQAETRPVIRTIVSTNDQQWPIDLTLTNRDMMGFRMLLGREAVRRRFLVDSGQSYLQSSSPKHKLKKSSPKSSTKDRKQKKTKSSQKLKHEDSNFIKKLRALFNPSA